MRRLSAPRRVLACLAAALLPTGISARAEKCDPALKVALLEATDAGVVEIAVPSGDAGIPLTFHVHGPRAGDTAQFVATGFGRTDGVGRAVGADLDARGDEAAPSRCPGADASIGCASFALDREWLGLSLSIRGLEPGAAYEGRLHFASERATRDWSIRVKTFAPGVVAVQKLPAIAVVNGPLFPVRRLLRSPLDGLRSWLATVARETDAGPAAATAAGEPRIEMPIALWDALGQGPHRRVRARAEINPTEAASETSTALPAAALSFSRCSRNGAGANGPTCQALDLYDTARAGEGVEIARHGQTALWLGVSELDPGEYRGALRFASEDGLAEDERSKLDLTVQVRDHWLVAVVLMVVGSFIGWFARVYLPARTERREMENRLGELARRARALDGRVSGTRRRLPHEAGSIGFARTHALLESTRTLIGSPLQARLLAKEFQEECAEIVHRIVALEKYAETREKLQSFADSSWTAHWQISRHLVAQLNRIDAPVVGEAESKDIVDALDKLVASWSASIVALAAALVDRRTAFQSDVRVSGPLPSDPNVAAMIASLDAIQPASNPTLEEDLLARLGFVWRHRRRAWLAALLPSIQTQPIETLFEAADQNLWEDWKAAAQPYEDAPIRLASNQSNPDAFEFVEFELSFDSDFATLVTMHPARVRWVFSSRSGEEVVEGDRSRCIRFFRKAGTVRASADLCWNAGQIPLGKRPFTGVDVKPPRSNTSVTRTELGFLVLAVGFAVLTGLVTNYGPTFGTPKQYLALFFWAAGVSAGGNAFFFSRRDAFGSELSTGKNS